MGLLGPFRNTGASVAASKVLVIQVVDDDDAALRRKVEICGRKACLELKSVSSGCKCRDRSREFLYQENCS